MTTAAADYIRARVDLAPQLALVLGSGLGAVADAVEDPRRFPYADLPGFPQPTVSSHRADVVIGRLSGTPVAVLSGRVHTYEIGDPAAMKTPLRTLAALGCSTVLLTNAAGSLREDVPPGSLMMITDHVNYAGLSPLIGLTGDERFVDMVDAYDPPLRESLRRAAAAAGTPLAEGVYIWLPGPQFETPAEIRAARVLGVDAVGMSTVPECILCRWLGLRVAAVSGITNYAAGMTGAGLSHAETKQEGAKLAGRMATLLLHFAKEIAP